MSLPPNGTVSLDYVLATGIADYSTLSDTSDGLGRRIEEVLVLAIRLASAIHAIHQQRIIHGAVNPASILIETPPTGTTGPPLVHISLMRSEPVPEATC